MSSDPKAMARHGGLSSELGFTRTPSEDDPRRDPQLLAAIEKIAPGTPLRQAVDDKRDVEAHFRKWHVMEEATIDHLVRSLAPEEPHADMRHDAVTETGLSVEDQIRKAWNNPVIGLAIF